MQRGFGWYTKMAASSGGSFDVIVVGGGVSGISALHQVGFILKSACKVRLSTIS